MVKYKAEVSAIILYFNDINIFEAIDSIKNQTIIPEEVIIIDDHSDIPIDENCLDPNFRVIRNSRNMGRGYSRNLGIKESKGEFVVFCDSSNSLCEDFIETSLINFKNNKISAVFGKIKGKEYQTDICSRWRERNLFLETYPQAKEPYEVFSLSTYSVMMRKSHVQEVGNFASNLRQFEDHDLGIKLIRRGYQFFFDPNLFCTSIRNDNLFQLAKRIDRWYSPSNESFNIKSIINLIETSLFIWIKRDLESKDYSGVFVSLIIPFLIIYQNISK
jgi:glycosyltransferase involved in cell wall biosynthesis